MPTHSLPLVIPFCPIMLPGSCSTVQRQASACRCLGGMCSCLLQPYEATDSAKLCHAVDHVAEQCVCATGNGEVPSARGGHQAAASDPAHVRSRDALLALQNQAPTEHGNASAPPRSIHQQTVAAQQSFLEAPSSSTSNQEQQLDEQLYTYHQQPGLVAAPDRRLLQRSGQDAFSGDLTDEHNTYGQSQSQKPPHQSSHWWQQDRLSSLLEAEQADESSSSQAAAAQQAQPRQSMHRRPRNSIGALHGEGGGGGSHMSPFAGFAALTKTRTSTDDRGDYRAGQTGHKSNRQSLEQMAGSNRIMKTVPKHIRRSLEATPGVRKSLESQAPPPASSSGMRNSKDGINAQTAEQASALWDEERRRSSLDASMQHNQQGVHSNMGVSTTIKEVPSDASSMDGDASDAGPSLATQSGTADNTAAAQNTDIGSSGLSKFSPFAVPGLTNAPSFL